MSSRLMRFAPIRSARFALPPTHSRCWPDEAAPRLAIYIAAPPATPGPGIVPDPPPPAPSPPDNVPPEIHDPSPIESPVPVREPPVMPPPMGLVRWYGASVRAASATTR